MTSTQKKVLALSWVTYASFYLLRVNMSVAIPGLMEQYGLTRTALGGVASAFFVMYAIGQFVNGQLADSISPKRMIGVGLLVSMLANLAVLSFGGIAAVLTIIWGLNGLVQAMGWSPSVKIVDAWFPEHRKGRASGILGTSYIVGGALSWILAGFLARYGWQHVFVGPAIICTIILTGWLLLGREHPKGRFERARIKDTLTACLSNRLVWFGGMGLFGLNIVRYGFLTWAPTFFFETQEAEITQATYKALIFPVAGVLGALVTGWLTDKWFKDRRSSVSLVLTLVLAVSCFLFPLSPNWGISLVLLAVIGFSVFGPHMFVVTQLPMLLRQDKEVASITGFIDGMGYVGASITGFVSGLLVDQFSWNHALYFWVFGAIIAGLFMFLSARKQ